MLRLPNHRFLIAVYLIATDNTELVMRSTFADSETIAAAQYIDTHHVPKENTFKIGVYFSLRLVIPGALLICQTVYQYAKNNQRVSLDNHDVGH